ncbi:MAG: hypothetical protein Fur0039_01770 [Rhodocyclaceae bacterium]
MELRRIHASDPGPLLEAAFARIERERMAGVPMLNRALRVEALAFSRWQGQWLGILVAPWFMNLVLVPGAGGGWRSVPQGHRIFHRLPAGDFAFLGGCEPEVGEFQSCALLSNMDRFPDQESARAVARAAVALVRAAAARPAGEAESAQAAKPAEAVRAEATSKREFLRSLLPRRA